jgi:uncharacterized protein with ParB-like and HNH nuclease domain
MGGDLMGKIENNQYTIGEAFTQCFYIVPDYQREYVWKEKEVYQLLEDISDEMSSSANQPYFIGTILVSPSSEINHFEVIDGQQRLTTLFLLLCAMKYIFKDKEQERVLTNLISTSYIKSDGTPATSLKLEPRYENAGELIQKIVETDSDPDTTKNAVKKASIKTFGSLVNLLEAYDTVYRYLIENYSQPAELTKFLGYVLTHVIFIQIKTDVSGALKIFETINERGIGLNPMDLLKNLLFTNVNQSEFTKLKDQWKKVTRPLDENKEKPLRFLRYFLMANYKIENSRKDNIVREDEIYDWFIDKKNAALCNYQQKPFDFVKKLILNVELFVDYSKGKGNDGQQNEAMDSLRTLCGGAFSLHYVLLLAASKLPKTLFDHFVVQLESFLFYYIYTKTATKELERNFSLWADELREIADEADQDDQVVKFNMFLKERFASNIQSKELELSDYLKRYTLTSMQQYRTRYLLSKLTQYVDLAYNQFSINLKEYTKLDIEHILPNNPALNLRNDFISKNPGKDYDDYKQRLGNLTLLEKPLNIVAGNDYFQKKCEIYKDSSYYLTRSTAQLKVIGANTSVNRINKKLMSFSDWNAGNIEKRQEMLIDLAKDVWKIEYIP